MRDTFTSLVKTEFLAIQRRSLESLLANLGYRCNLSFPRKLVCQG